MALHELLADPGFVVTIKLIQVPVKDNVNLKVTNSGDTKCSVTASELQISMYIYDWIEHGICQKGDLTSSITKRQF